MLDIFVLDDVDALDSGICLHFVSTWTYHILAAYRFGERANFEQAVRVGVETSWRVRSASVSQGYDETMTIRSHNLMTNRSGRRATYASPQA